MASASKGDTVRIHYTGRLDDGTVFDSSEGRDPLEFEVGAGQVIPGFDASVEGMEAGEEKTVTIPADEAYGPRNDQLVLHIPRDNLPPDLNPEPGQELVMQTADGQRFPVVVTAVGEDGIDVDANHPLAGKDLTFDIQLVEVVEG